MCTVNGKSIAGLESLNSQWEKKQKAEVKVEGSA